MKKCIDLYSWIGWWTLGMKLNWIKNVKSYEWNKYSNLTHNINFNTNTKEADIRKLDFQNDLPKSWSIDFIVWSPPCTQFSYSNKWWNWNIEDGLVDMYQFLSVIDYMKPKYWAMENVPRVKKILDDILDNNERFKKFKKLFNFNEVIDISEYWLPQKRKRMIAGNFPYKLLLEYKENIKVKNLWSVINALKNEVIVDPNYLYEIGAQSLSDHIKEEELTVEELRINKESKTFHPVYNWMSFPEKVDTPSRTITSTCTRVSRESLIINDNSHYRRLTLRERATLMGFPITFQFYGNSYSEKMKMIWNSIPPVMTNYIFQSMLEVPSNEVNPVSSSLYVHVIPKVKIPLTYPPKNTPKYKDDRSFKFAIPNFRFWSGVRLELSNKNDGKLLWRLNFFYGTSKKIYQVNLNKKDYSRLVQDIIKIDDTIIETELKWLIGSNDSVSLQQRWNNKTKKGIHPFEIVDLVWSLGINLYEKIADVEIKNEDFEKIIWININKKLYDNKALIISWLIVAYIFNTNIK